MGPARGGNAAGSEHVLSTCMLGTAAVALCITRSWVSAYVQGDAHEFMVQNATAAVPSIQVGKHAHCLQHCLLRLDLQSRLRTQRTGHNRPGTDTNAALTYLQQSKRIRMSLSAADVWIHLLSTNYVEGSGVSCRRRLFLSGERSARVRTRSLWTTVQTALLDIH